MLRLITFPLRLAWSLFVILTPLLGVWVASSLAAYLNGPMWLAVLSGALLFPLGPLLWELRATQRWHKKNKAREDDDDDPRERTLSFWDRMTLRTMVLNLVVLAALLAYFPKEAFTALSTRGDWMLRGRSGAGVEVTRDVLFATADGLEWLHELARDNPYEQYADDDDQPTPDPNTFPEQRGDDDGDDGDGAVARDGDPDEGTGKDGDTTQRPEKERQPGDPPRWPFEEKLHPAVANMPESAKKDIDSVARYIAEREDDPFLRVKALHDFVADHVAYDAPALARGEYPSQDAEHVFETGEAVCAGYAQLLMALGQKTGDEIVYVVGVSRELGGDVSGGGHAWNAAKIEGRWYLIDATWNAGSVNGTTYEKSYGTDYLFTPPHIFGLDHFPDKQSWQLREDPISRGEFTRQPILKPGFFSNGLDLISPKRSQVSVTDEAVIVLHNPQGARVIASLVPKGQSHSAGEPCEVERGAKTRISCEVPGPGTYQVGMFSKMGPPGGLLPFVGQIEVTR